MQKLFAIRLLLGYVLGNAYSPQELALFVIDGRLQGNHFPEAVLPHDMLPEAAGLAGLLHILLGLQADKLASLVFLLAEPPDIVMLLATDVLLGLVHYLAEGVIDAPMLPVAPLEPDEVHAGVNHRLQLQLPQPGILLQLYILHQPGKEQLCRVKGQPAGPHIIHSGQLTARHAGSIITANNAHSLITSHFPDTLRSCTGRSFENKNICLLHINPSKAVSRNEVVGKPLQRLYRPHCLGSLGLYPHQIDIQVTFIHARLTPLIPQINVEFP